MKFALIVLTITLSLAHSENVFAKSGTNIGGGNLGSEYIASWCRGQTSLLRNYLSRADLKVEHSGDYASANKILNNGIIQALSDNTNGNDAILVRSLNRGLEIARSLEATSAKNSERKSFVVNNVLRSYYNFMINTVANNVGEYTIGHRDDMDRDATLIEKKFVEYASQQLNWITQNLVSESRLGNKMQIIPVGEARSVLKVMLTLSAGTSEDLNDSLWNRRFSCAIQDLNVLNDTLTQYDQGNREMFDDEKEALTYATTELRRVASNITLNNSCR
jgi:hypothetical protein